MSYIFNTALLLHSEQGFYRPYQVSKIYIYTSTIVFKGSLKRHSFFVQWNSQLPHHVFTVEAPVENHHGFLFGQLSESPRASPRTSMDKAFSVKVTQSATTLGQEVSKVAIPPIPIELYITSIAVNWPKKPWAAPTHKHFTDTHRRESILIYTWKRIHVCWFYCFHILQLLGGAKFKT